MFLLSKTKSINKMAKMLDYDGYTCKVLVKSEDEHYYYVAGYGRVPKSMVLIEKDRSSTKLAIKYMRMCPIRANKKSCFDCHRLMLCDYQLMFKGLK